MTARSVVASGDLKNNLDKLKIELRGTKGFDLFDSTKLGGGDPVLLLQLLHYILLNLSRLVARDLANKGYRLLGSSDQRFVETVLQIARNEFSYRLKLTKDQVLSTGFAERKITFACDLLKLVKRKHKELYLLQYKQKAGTSFGSRGIASHTRAVEDFEPARQQRKPLQCVTDTSDTSTGTGSNSSSPTFQQEHAVPVLPESTGASRSPVAGLESDSLAAHEPSDSQSAPGSVCKDEQESESDLGEVADSPEMAMAFGMHPDAMREAVSEPGQPTNSSRPSTAEVQESSSAVIAKGRPGRHQVQSPVLKSSASSPSLADMYKQSMLAAHRQGPIKATRANAVVGDPSKFDGSIAHTLNQHSTPYSDIVHRRHVQAASGSPQDRALGRGMEKWVSPAAVGHASTGAPAVGFHHLHMGASLYHQSAAPGRPWPGVSHRDEECASEPGEAHPQLEEASSPSSALRRARAVSRSPTRRVQRPRRGRTLSPTPARRSLGADVGPYASPIATTGTDLWFSTEGQEPRGGAASGISRLVLNGGADKAEAAAKVGLDAAMSPLLPGEVRKVSMAEAVNLASSQTPRAQSKRNREYKAMYAGNLGSVRIQTDGKRALHAKPGAKASANETAVTRAGAKANKTQTPSVMVCATPMANGCAEGKREIRRMSNSQQARQRKGDTGQSGDAADQNQVVPKSPSTNQGIKATTQLQQPGNDGDVLLNLSRKDVDRLQTSSNQQDFSQNQPSLQMDQLMSLMQNLAMVPDRIKVVEDRMSDLVSKVDDKLNFLNHRLDTICQHLSLPSNTPEKAQRPLKQEKRKEQTNYRQVIDTSIENGEQSIMEEFHEDSSEGGDNESIHQFDEESFLHVPLQKEEGDGSGSFVTSLSSLSRGSSVLDDDEEISSSSKETSNQQQFPDFISSIQDRFRETACYLEHINDEVHTASST